MTQTSASISPLAPSADLMGVIKLSHLGMITAQGADTETFLHGQLTQDVLHLSPGQLRLGGYCSAKGRLMTTFWFWRPQAGEVHLLMPADVLPGVLKRLRMFVLRAKTKLTHASDAGVVDGQDAAQAPVLLGATGSEGQAWALAQAGLTTPPPPGTVHTTPAAMLLRLADVGEVPRYMMVVQGSSIPAVPTAAGSGLTEATWRWLEVLSGTPLVGLDTSERFVPQTINLELVGGVDFQKGCYPGQEVVARSQYRGAVKRRGQRLHGTAPMQPGQDVFHSADPSQPCGTVVMSAPRPASQGAGWDALAEVKLAALEGGTLHLGQADGTELTLQALPYAVPPTPPAAAASL